MSSTSAFAEHQAWLQQIQSQYAAHTNQTRPQPATGAPAEAAFDESALPLAPEMWAHTGAADEDALQSQFGSLDFEYEEGPVYRSMSMMPPSVLDVDADVDEGPVFRSMGGLAPDAAAPAAGPQPSPPTTSALERTWLETMPPLVRRQRGASTLALGL